MAQADQPQIPGLAALQVELAELYAGVRHFQGRLREVAIAADERNRQLQSKVEELVAQNLARAIEIRQLESQNAELTRTIEAKEPVLAKAIHARDNTLKQLERAHKLIEDLLSDRKTKDIGDAPTRSLADDKSATAPPGHSQHPTRERHIEPESSSPTTDFPMNDESISVALRKNRGSGRDATVNHYETDEDSTVRPQSSLENSTVVVPYTYPSKRTAGGTRVSPTSSESSQETAVDAPPSRPSSKGSKMKDQRLAWYLEFATGPATAELQAGAIPFDYLAEQLVLNDDTTFDVGDLGSLPGFDLRIHTEGNVAFVYRPVILEGPKTTYLIGWANPSMVQRVHNWVKEPQQLHMFLYPAIENSGWFYVGLHTFSYTTLESVWGKISKENKQELFAELQDRNPDMDVQQFKRDVRTGNLVQCCIQLKSKGNTAESHEFMREYELFDQPDARGAAD